MRIYLATGLALLSLRVKYTDSCRGINYSVYPYTSPPRGLREKLFHTIFSSPTPHFLLFSGLNFNGTVSA